MSKSPVKTKKKKKNTLDFAAVEGRTRQECSRAVVQALASLTKADFASGDISFYQGLPTNLPMDLGGSQSVPVSISTPHAEAEAVVLMSVHTARAVVNLMIGEEIGANLPAFDELHRSVLVEAVAGLLPNLQAAASKALGMPVEMEVGPTVDDRLGNLSDSMVVYAGLDLKADPDFSGTIALVIEQEGCIEIIETRPEPEPAAASFAGFQQLRTDPSMAQGKNLGLLLDVPMQMVAVLGRRGVKLRDLLQMGPGSILELDKLAGEPLELLVNGKLIGYGEVIVLDEKFGIKVRDVVNPEDRLRSANL